MLPDERYGLLRNISLRVETAVSIQPLIYFVLLGCLSFATPVRWTPSGRHRFLAETDDPIMDIAWPRPDFRLAAIEFLIGCLSTFAPPENEATWRTRWRDPPRVEELDAAFAPYAHAFDLDGDGPRFMQALIPLWTVL